MLISPCKKRSVAAVALLIWPGSGILVSRAQEILEESDARELVVEHAECTLFGPNSEQLRASGLAAEARRRFALGRLTAEVVPMLGGASPLPDRLTAAGSGAGNPQEFSEEGTIDGHLFRAMREAGVKPAPKTTDYEFIRRVSLDLTGRVPPPDRLRRFVADMRPDKRARLVDELLETPEWVDKWTMYFGDLYKNNSRNTQIVRYAEGRNAFHKWIKTSLETNKPYNKLVTELITAAGPNSWEQGELNWLVGGFVTGSPRGGQDLFDQQAANTAETFLGIAHMNCILCHNGRRHLDELSLWGKTAVRMEGYQLAAFYSRTDMQAVRAYPPPANERFYSIEDNRTYRVDYPLNTTTGNRPARAPIGTITNVKPVYPFNGRGPEPGENYRASLARELTADLQFARATVNYIWKEFFGRGMVEPVNQFDPARLDPDNPPPAPWKLQPTNGRLLDALARDFINAGFDLKALMRQVVNSDAYQLASRYEGTWNPDWVTLFARKFVRRLWGEEIHDAVAQTSAYPPSYNIRTFGVLRWAMQLPEPVNLPGGDVTTFLDSFLRGNRDDEERRPDGSISQALNLMNDSFVMSRTRSLIVSGIPNLTRRLLGYYPAPQHRQLVEEMFLTVLSRPPREAEMNLALASLATAATEAQRQQRVEDLLWSLYNKVDFIFNY